MLGEKSFDERQLIVRGRLGFETMCLSLFLIMISAFFADEIIAFMDMSDYLICVAFAILTYYSVRSIWKDAYVGIYENNAIIWIFLILFVLNIALMIMDTLHNEPLFHKDNIMSFAVIIFEGLVFGTFMIKRHQEKE